MMKRRIKQNRIIGIMGFREHFSSHPGKHSWNLCGHPVYWWAMRSAMDTRYLEKILVWTEDKEAQRIAKDMSDKFVIFNRTIEECKEPMWKFVDDFKGIKSRVNTQKAWHLRDDEIRELVGFEPTLQVSYAANQPLIKAESYTRMIEKYFTDDFAEVAAMAVKFNMPNLCMRNPEHPEYLIPMLGLGHFTARQERLQTYAFLGPRIDPYKDRIHSISRRIVFIEVGEDEFADIHDEKDLELAEFKMKKRLEKEIENVR